MTYEIVEPTKRHRCDLPDPERFPPGAVIRCTAEIRLGSSLRWPIRCDRKWLRAETFWRGP